MTEMQKLLTVIVNKAVRPVRVPRSAVRNVEVAPYGDGIQVRISTDGFLLPSSRKGQRLVAYKNRVISSLRRHDLEGDDLGTLTDWKNGAVHAIFVDSVKA